MKKLPRCSTVGWFACFIIAAALVPFSPLRAKEAAPSRKAPQQGKELFAPVVIPPGARTEADVDKEEAAWFERVVVQPGLARLEARKDAAWAADAERLLKQAPKFAMALRVVVVPEELLGLAQKLLDAGCDEPSTMLMAGFIGLRAGKDWRFIYNCSMRADKGWVADLKTPAVLRFHTNQLYVWANERNGFPPDTEKWEKIAIKRLPKMMTDGSYKPGEEGLFLRHITAWEQQISRYPQEFMSEIDKLETPEWVRMTVVGGVEKALAWKARGSGFANTVTEERRKGFAEHLQKSREALTKAWEANPKSPVAAAEMIAIVMGGNTGKGETERLWFDRAVAAQCDYQPAYKSLMNACLPRWGGSHALMLAFGKACADTKRYDTDIPANFSQACNLIVSEIGDWRAFYRLPEVAGPLLEVSEGWLKEPSRAGERQMRQGFLAVNAWLAGDRAKAAGALKQAGEPLHNAVSEKLASHRVSERDFREEVALANSTIAAEFAKADALFKEGKIAESAAIFKKIEPSAPGEAGEGVRERLQIIGIEQRLATGEWVKLPVAPGLRGWLPRGGIWTGEADGTLVNKGNDSFGLLIHRARVGAGFEMRMVFSVDAKEGCCRQCGIIFGWHPGFMDPMNMASYGQHAKNPAEARFRMNYAGEPSEKIKIPLRAKNSLVLRCSDGKLTFTVNGKEAFTDYQPRGMVMGPEDGRVGIGNLRWCIMNTTRVTEIEVRRLPPQPNNTK